MPAIIQRATAVATLENLVSADGSSGGFVKDSDRASAAQARDATNSSAVLTPASLLDVGAVRLLWRLIGANMNTTADQAFEKVGTFTTFHMINALHALNPSASLTTAQGGIYTATSKGGDALVASTQAYTQCTTPTTGQAITRLPTGNGLRSDTALYLSLTTPQGSAATADFYLFGVVFS